MIEFATEILARPLEATSSEGAHCALALAQTAWNREVDPDGPDHSPAAYLQLMATFEADNPRARTELVSYDCEAMIEQLRQRKRQRHPADDRLIHACGTTEEGKVHVEWTSKAMAAERTGQENPAGGDDVLTDDVLTDAVLADAGLEQSPSTVCSIDDMTYAWDTLLQMSSEQITALFERMQRQQPDLMEYCEGLHADGTSTAALAILLKVLATLYLAFTHNKRPMAPVREADFVADLSAIERLGSELEQQDARTATMDTMQALDEPWAMAFVVSQLKEARIFENPQDVGAGLGAIAAVRAFHRETGKVKGSSEF